MQRVLTAEVSPYKIGYEFGLQNSKESARREGTSTTVSMLRLLVNGAHEGSARLRGLCSGGGFEHAHVQRKPLLCTHMMGKVGIHENDKVSSCFSQSVNIRST